MRYDKPALTFGEQVEYLQALGLDADEVRLERKLQSVSYHRLSAYWHPFCGPDGRLIPGSTFEEVWGRYAFDRSLRLLVMDALERIEVAIRCRVASSLGQRHGPFGYIQDPKALVHLGSDKRLELLLKIREDLRKSTEPFLVQFRTKYGDTHANPPIWMATEVMSFGTLLTVFRASDQRVHEDVAGYFGLAVPVMDSWLHSLHVIRNLCAHHGRLWNRTLGVRPKLPLRHADPDWHHPIVVENSRVFAILTILCYGLHRLTPRSGWARGLVSLCEGYPRIPLHEMGIPTDWTSCPIWERMLRHQVGKGETSSWSA